MDYHSHGQLSAFSSLGLFKLAGRMEAALRAGEIALHDVDPAAKGLSELRSNLRAPSMHPNLGRLRKIREKSYLATAKNPGTGIIAPLPEERIRDLSELEARYDLSQDVQAAIRPGFSSEPYGGQPSSAKAQPDRIDIELDVSSKDPLARATLQHELQEARLMGAGAGPRTGEVTAVASHLGVAPVISEANHLAGDPRAVSRMAAIHERIPEELFLQSLLTNAGHTIDHPIPIGGKQHRAISSKLRSLADTGMLESKLEFRLGQGTISDQVDSWGRSNKPDPTMLLSKHLQRMGIENNVDSRSSLRQIALSSNRGSPNFRSLADIQRAGRAEYIKTEKAWDAHEAFIKTPRYARQ